MYVKKYIHPRNKYKKPPNYKKLAIMYPEFREVAITDLAGKVRIDFQKKGSVRVLTETLLKHDFDIHVSIPPDKLNPALTLRMNYILWIEDLMNYSKLMMDETTGIDIGTGAIGIYALLLAKIYKCHMIGTEVDKESIEHAENCIKRNNLQDLIKVITVNSDSIFKDAVEKDKTYDFSMCNPPFFENEGDSERVAKALPPRNAPTGDEGELKTKGGELAFVTKMIEESIELGDRIKVYTTMIGKKVDFFHLKKVIKSSSIENTTWTVFCQGHTTRYLVNYLLHQIDKSLIKFKHITLFINRWGLAWSFLPKDILDLNTAPVIRKVEKFKMSHFENKSSIMFPMNDKFSCIDDVINFLNTTAEELNIKLQEVPISEDGFDGWVCQLTAEERTWEHARRKRRLAQQLALKKLEDPNGECVEVSVNTKESSDTVLTTEQNIDLEQANEKPPKETLSVKKEKYGENSKESIPLLTCKLWVQIESSEIEETVPQDDLFRISMIFESGSGGLEALQSLRQYLMNRLEVKRTALQDPSKPIKKRRKRMKKHSDESVPQNRT